MELQFAAKSLGKPVIAVEVWHLFVVIGHISPPVAASQCRKCLCEGYCLSIHV